MNDFEEQKSAEERSCFYQMHTLGDYEKTVEYFKAGLIIRWSLFEGDDIYLWPMDDYEHNDVESKLSRRDVSRGFFTKTNGIKFSDFRLPSSLEREAMKIAINRFLK